MVERILTFILFLSVLNSSEQVVQHSRQYSQSQRIENGNCYYENGVLHDISTGDTRPLTSDEISELAQFESQMSRWQAQIQVITQKFAQRMQHLFSYPGGVGMDPWPPMPQVPCFCTSCNKPFVMTSSMVQNGPFMYSQGGSPGVFSSVVQNGPGVSFIQQQAPITVSRKFVSGSTFPFSVFSTNFENDPSWELSN